MVKCNLSRIMGEKRLKIADVSRDTEAQSHVCITKKRPEWI